VLECVTEERKSLKKPCCTMESIRKKNVLLRGVAGKAHFCPLQVERELLSSPCFERSSLERRPKAFDGGSSAKGGPSAKTKLFDAPIWNAAQKTRSLPGARTKRQAKGKCRRHSSPSTNKKSTSRRRRKRTLVGTAHAGNGEPYEKS